MASDWETNPIITAPPLMERGQDQSVLDGAPADGEAIEAALLALGFGAVPAGHRLAAFTIVRETIDANNADHQKIICLERYSADNARLGVLTSALHAIVDMIAVETTKV